MANKQTLLMLLIVILFATLSYCNEIRYVMTTNVCWRYTGTNKCIVTNKEYIAIIVTNVNTNVWIYDKRKDPNNPKNIHKGFKGKTSNRW